jgi:uncharacterized membrane protein
MIEPEDIKGMHDRYLISINWTRIWIFIGLLATVVCAGLVLFEAGRSWSMTPLILTILSFERAHKHVSRARVCSTSDLEFLIAKAAE